MRLLLVEDDARIARFVAKGLREESYAVDTVENGNDAVYQTEINDYDLIVLDVMIPGMDGFAVCKAIRAGGKRTPILMLTAKDGVDGVGLFAESFGHESCDARVVFDEEKSHARIIRQFFARQTSGVFWWWVSFR